MIDWATISFPCEARAAVQAALKVTDWEAKAGSLGYAERLVYRLGDSVACNMLIDGSHHQRGREVVSLSGGWFSEFGDDVLVTLLRIEGARMTRVDLAYDDRDGDLQWGPIYDATKSGQMVGFRKVYDNGAVLGDRGRTLYFGKRGSKGNGRFVRIYDKAAEQDTPEYMPGAHWMRFEVELSGDCAKQFGESWLDAYEGRVRYYKDECLTGAGFRAAAQFESMVLVGSIDFRELPDDRDVDRHLSRRARLAWWQRVIDKISGGAAIRICRKEPVESLEEYAEKFKIRSARALRLLRVAYTAKEDGPSRWQDYHEALFSAGLTTRQYRRLRGWIESGEFEYFTVHGNLSRAVGL